MKWAKCNLGAETETDYGDYFQWGETTPDTDYTWATYKYCNGSERTLTKYNNSTSYGENLDNITVLETVDDAATQIMSSDWRMPTKAEFDELLRGTTNEWIADYEGTGVSGRKFTSRANGNSIFIPAAGNCHGGSVYDVGSNSRVWSSLVDFDESPSGAWMLYFDSDDCFMSTDYRSNGLTVRGVRK